MHGSISCFSGLPSAQISGRELVPHPLWFLPPIIESSPIYKYKSELPTNSRTPEKGQVVENPSNPGLVGCFAETPLKILLNSKLGRFGSTPQKDLGIL